MAKKDKSIPKIKDTKGGNFGKYQESTGGGHPFDSGNSNTRTTRENGKLRQKENPKTNQPRTNDGKFTYKSANGKSIDPKYGPSRGKTVNPVLTGGKNGIKIEDVEKQFGEEKGKIWDEFKDKWYQKGGEVVSGKDLKTKVTVAPIWEVAKEFNENLGEFKYNIHGEDMAESEMFKSKSGRKTSEEKAAAEKAAKSGKYQYVYNKDKKTGDKSIKAFQKKKVAPQPSPVAPQPTPFAPQPQPSAQSSAPKQESAAPAPSYTPKYDQGKLDKINSFFASKFANDTEKVQKIKDKLDSMSPEEKDKQIDLWISKGANFGF